ncbi:hypothetical protein E2542_SST04266 [Spatholobus suberectus]|nr:hypothetical protein E2542_SST04266 [Spatholobus suberectus]
MLIDGSGFIDFILEAQLFFGWMCFPRRFSNNSLIFRAQCKLQGCGIVQLVNNLILFFCPKWLGGSSHVRSFLFLKTNKNFPHKLQLNRVATFSKSRGIYGALI